MLTEVIETTDTVPVEPLSPPYPNIAQSFGLILILLGMQLIARILLSLITTILPRSLAGNESIMLGTEILSYVWWFTLTISVVWGKKKKAETQVLKLLPESHIHQTDIFVLILLTPLLALAIEPLSLLLPSIEFLDKALIREWSKILRPNILSFCFIAILPAIFEEFLFRRILLDGLLKKYRPATSIFISALIFGMVHFNLPQFLGAFLAGIFLGWVYFRTRSLVACMLIHATNNAFAFFLGLKYGITATGYDLFGLKSYVILVVLSMLIFVTGIFWLSARLR